MKNPISDTVEILKSAIGQSNAINVLVNPDYRKEFINSFDDIYNALILLIKKEEDRLKK